jgi:hypothetical protein
MPRCQRRGEARQSVVVRGRSGAGFGGAIKDRGEANGGRGWLGSGAVMDELGVGCPRLQFACGERFTGATRRNGRGRGAE